MSNSNFDFKIVSVKKKNKIFKSYELSKGAYIFLGHPHSNKMYMSSLNKLFNLY